MSPSETYATYLATLSDKELAWEYGINTHCFASAPLLSEREAFYQARQETWKTERRKRIALENAKTNEPQP